MTPESLPAPRACCFDLDGTLVDSLRDLGEALNHCLELLGLPTHSIDRYRYMVGEGMPKLCQRAVGATHPHLTPRLTELARVFYRTRILRHTRPYPGVPELVNRLRHRGLRLAVLSNKPHALTNRIVRSFWPDNTFAVIQGYEREEHRKPSPHHVNEICAALAVQPSELWLIGDTPTDVETAARAGAPCVAVTWGFRTRGDLEAAGANCIVDHPEQIA